MTDHDGRPPLFWRRALLTAILYCTLTSLLIGFAVGWACARLHDSQVAVPTHFTPVSTHPVRVLPVPAPDLEIVPG